MISHTKTWKLRWKILALVAVLFLGVTTMTDAQTTKRSAAEIQAEIERLQGELADTKKTENAVAPQPADGRQPSDKDGAAKNLARYSGDYIGTEGDDRIGIRIGTPEKNVYPITIYEDGLPGKGYDPKDDDKYVGTASFSDGKFEIRLMKKFDGRKEEKVESALQALTATFQPIDAKIDSKGFYLTIPRNREWDAVRVAPVPAKPESKSLTTSDSLPGDYLGWEDDDRIGIRIGKPAQPSGEFPVTIYENGLPGRGHDPNDDDRYEGVATFKAGNLEITLTKKFDENVEESVERALRKLTARTGLENNKPTLFIPANREWKDVKVTKGGE